MGGRGPFGESGLIDSMLLKKSSMRVRSAPVPQTDSGGRGEDPKAFEITTVKELGIIAP